MASTKSYYDILGVKKDASDDAIKKAFRKLARTHHPDAGGSEEKFKEINEAYEVLSDSEKRAQYDQYGQYFSGGTPPSGAGGWPGGGGGWPPGQDPFRGGGRVEVGNLGDLFGDLFGGGGFGGQRGPRRGQDLTVDVSVSFEEAYAGTSVKVDTGRGKPITVHIPAGVTEGGKLRFAGKGSPGEAGAPAGDMYVITRIRPHSYYSRDGANVVLDLPVSIGEAALGTEVTVPTPDGSKVKLRIPPGTHDGKVLRISGKGAPKLKGKGAGDLKVRVRLTVPSELTPEQRDLLEQFEALRTEDLREHMK